MSETIAGILVISFMSAMIALYVWQHSPWQHFLWQHPLWKHYKPRVSETTWAPRHPKMERWIGVGIYAAVWAVAIYFWVTDPHSHSTMVGGALFVLFRGLRRAFKGGQGGGTHTPV